MATFGSFADLTPAQVELAQRRQANTDPLSALIQGLQQGVQVAQMPQQLASQALMSQVKTALAQQQLQDLQNPEAALQRKIKEAIALKQALPTEVAGSLAGINPVTGKYETLYTAPSTSSSSPSYIVLPSEQGFVPFQTRGPQAGTIGQPLALGGQQLTKTPTASSVQDVQFTDAQGNLFVRPKGSTQSNPVLGPDGSQINAGVANKILSSDEGFFTVPSKGPASATAVTTQPVIEEEGGGGASAGEPQILKPLKRASGNSEQSLRKEFNTLPTVKNFNELSRQMNIMRSAFDQLKTGGSKGPIDQSLVTTFNKILDPTSVVRESEYARTPEGAALLRRIQGRVESFVTGGIAFTDAERQDLLNTAEALFDRSRDTYQTTENFYRGIAERGGLDPELIIAPQTPQRSSQAPAGTQGSQAPTVIRSIRRKQ